MPFAQLLQRSNSRTLLISIWFVAVPLCLGFVSVCAQETNLETQRLNYKKAKLALSKNRLSEYENLKETLIDYPLVMYLHYREGLRNLTSIRPEEATAIREKLRGSYLYDEFHKRWLAEQIKRNRWAVYAEYFEPTDDVIANCYYLRALYRTGEQEKAMGLVPDYWVVGISQPPQCNPIFDVWINKGNLTHDLLWQRLGLALGNESLTLARYLRRFFSEVELPAANFFIEVHRRPEIVRNPRNFLDTAKGREILVYGLKKFARQNSREPRAIEARSIWLDHHSSFNFDRATIDSTSSELAFWATRKGELIEPVNPNFSERTKLRIVDTAISVENWDLALQWLETCSEETKKDFKWQFWYSVASIKLGKVKPIESLENLAKKRTYYGFLAADELNLPIQLNEHVWEDVAYEQSIHRSDPRIFRVLELYEIGESTSAKNEWVWLMPKLKPAAKRWLAFEIGHFTDYPHHGIEAAYRADASNLISTRFPIPKVHRNQFEKYTTKTGVPLPVLLALTRQESAFNHAAISPVGARGLMQLMPATARSTARRIRVPTPTLEEIIYPPVNIQIGSYHFYEMLDRYDGHKALALAAYNAGFNRVDRWIEDASGMDTRIWIETIPFHETRSYVKNVLAYIQVYSRLLDEPVPMFADHEKTIP